ncbi:MAG: hypothetical protein KatS3mg031_0536 [Chitinophagales bacterium]|nr:MAG: hypothetical protein KatS3mg031_0536 [Chitinophagales bacterium]
MSSGKGKTIILTLTVSWCLLLNTTENEASAAGVVAGIAPMDLFNKQHAHQLHLRTMQ